MMPSKIFITSPISLCMNCSTGNSAYDDGCNPTAICCSFSLERRQTNPALAFNGVGLLSSTRRCCRCRKWGLPHGKAKHLALKGPFRGQVAEARYSQQFGHSVALK